MNTEILILVLVLIFVFYILPIKFCLSSIKQYYGEGGIGEGDTVSTVDVLITLIPIFNIFVAAKSLLMEVKKEQNTSVGGGRNEVRDLHFTQERRRYAPPPAPRISKDKIKKKNDDSGSIKFNF